MQVLRHFKLACDRSAVTAVLFLSVPLFLHAQPSHTGSHIAGSNTSSSYVVQLAPSAVIDNIRALLLSGQTVAALALAQKHIAELESFSPEQNALPRYHAYNALCAVFLDLRQSAKAIDACSTAMAIDPRQWEAISNRGTAYLLDGQFEAAAEDYREAMPLVPSGNEDFKAIVEHNLQLVAEQRKYAP